MNNLRSSWYGIREKGAIDVDTAYDDKILVVTILLELPPVCGTIQCTYEQNPTSSFLMVRCKDTTGDIVQCRVPLDFAMQQRVVITETVNGNVITVRLTRRENPAGEYT